MCRPVDWQTDQVSGLQWCMVLDEDFATLDSNVWNHEVQLNGFG